MIRGNFFDGTKTESLRFDPKVTTLGKLEETLSTLKNESITLAIQAKKSQKLFFPVKNIPINRLKYFSKQIDFFIIHQDNDQSKKTIKNNEGKKNNKEIEKQLDRELEDYHLQHNCNIIEEQRQSEKRKEVQKWRDEMEANMWKEWRENPNFWRESDPPIS